MVASRNQIISNITTVEGYLRLSVEWLDAMRRAVEQMNIVIQFVEAQPGPSVIHNTYME